MFSEGRKDQPFKYLDGRTEEGNWSVGGRILCWFGRFKERDDNGSFPYGRDGAGGRGDVEEGGEELLSLGPDVLEVEGGQVVWTKGLGRLGLLDSFSGLFCCKSGRIGKIFFLHLFCYFTICFGADMPDHRRKLFIEIVSNVYGVGNILSLKFD